MIPRLRPKDFERGGTGVRVQAPAPDDHRVDDFLIVPQPRMLHVLNAPSPAATSVFSNASYLVERIPWRLGRSDGRAGSRPGCSWRADSAG